MIGKKIHYINLRILKLLKEQNKSYENLADYLGIISPLHIRQQLLSRESPGNEQLREIAIFLGVSFKDLIIETFEELRSPGNMLLDQVPDGFLAGLFTSRDVNDKTTPVFKVYKDSKELAQDIKLCWN